MFIAQKVAGYSMGQADVLRKAMGKKKQEVLDAGVRALRGRHAVERAAAGRLLAGGDQGPVGHDPPVRRVRVQQVARGRLRAGVVLDRLPQGELPGRVHGGAAHLGGGQQGQVGGVPVRVPPARASRCCRRTSTSRACASPRSAPTSASAWARSATSAPTSSSRSSGPARARARTRRSPTSWTSRSWSCCNKRVVESLIKAGAFDSLGHTRLSLVQVHEEAVEAVVGLKRQEAMGQFDLFGGDDTTPGAERLVPAGAPAVQRRGVAAQAAAGLRTGDARPVRVGAPAGRRRAAAAQARPEADRRDHQRRAEGGRDRAVRA